VSRQCELAGLTRSSYYYQPQDTESAENLHLIKVIDREYLKHPYYGSRRMTKHLRDRGYPVNRKRIGRLMQVMGIQGVTPGPHTSKPHPQHPIYPYLLRHLKVRKPDQVWCADITYIPMDAGHLYLVAIMDWYSRYVLEWELSNSLENSFCIEALQRALRHRQPEIFNTDQGSQFTSPLFTEPLTSAEVRISMDGRGRALDNVFIERLWWSVKYEEVYLRDYEDAVAARHYLKKYFRFYNQRRGHQQFDYRTPAAIYSGN
jgi:putative transposase